MKYLSTFIEENNFLLVYTENKPSFDDAKRILTKKNAIETYHSYVCRCPY
jgi:hypothetical protein